jgi:hypothetical protein
MISRLTNGFVRGDLILREKQGSILCISMFGDATRYLITCMKAESPQKSIGAYFYIASALKKKGLG